MEKLRGGVYIQFEKMKTLCSSLQEAKGISQSVVKCFTRRRKARKGEVKGSRKVEYVKNLVGAGLAPALFYFTERGRTQEKVVEFTRRRKARKELRVSRGGQKHAKIKKSVSRLMGKRKE